MNELHRKIALVTAASRGIGKASAKKLAENGATVYIAAVDMDEAREAVKEITNDGGRAACIYYDATDEQTYDTMIKEVLGEAKKIDILVNNFGFTDTKKDLDLIRTEKDDFLRIVNCNLLSIFLPCKRIIPYMIQNGGGSIVNISSTGSLFPEPGRTAYGLAKASVNFMTQEIAVQYARHNIRCNAVLPGLTSTEAVKKFVSEEYQDLFVSHIPLHRAGEPEDLAEAVLFLASDRSSFITGQLLPVTGGFGIATPLYAHSVNTKKM